MKIKYLIGLIIGITIILISIYFFILPPRVISISPPDQSRGVNLNSPLIIKFDKPVKRRAPNHFIIPEAYGEWKFEDPLIKNHFFRTLVFTPAVDFKPNTQYQVKIESVISPLGMGLSSNFSFSFKTQVIFSEEISQNKTSSEKPTESQSTTSLLTKAEPKITLLNIPLDWQDYPLSCEAASLKMALAAKNVYVSEDEIMGKIGFDTTPNKNGVWGDPYKAFVGDIDGEIGNTGYGVYWEPVAKAVNAWRPSEAFSGWTLKNLVEEIRAGNPVLVWGILPVKTIHDISWFTPEGKYIRAFKETHVRLVIGFIGSEEQISQIILNDPLNGRLYWPTSEFLKNWKVFNYSGVVVR